MGDFIAGIMFFLLALILWAGIGHLIWLFLSAMTRSIFGEKCHRCGRKHLGGGCPKCGARPTAIQPSAAPQAPSVQADLAAAHRLISFSKFHRWLDNEQHAALDQLVNRLASRIESESMSAAQSAETAAAIEQAKTALSTPPDGASLKTPPRQPQPLAPQTLAPNPISPGPLSKPKKEPAKPMIPRHMQPPVAVPLPSTPPNTPPSAPSSTPIHPLDREDDEPVVVPPKAPLKQRLTADLLKSFMEQSNIRWVELISATLIVVCSVGLVISLWSTLSSTSRFFPSLVFLLATVAVHGAGQYTLKKWKLRTTSRGILHIGLMLIPLAMLVGILLSRRDQQLPALDLITAGVIAFGTAVYGALAVTASKSLFSRNWPVVASITIVSSLTLLPIHYLAERSILTTPSATWALLPLVLVSLNAALLSSRMSLRFLGSATRVASGRLRRLGGMVTQCLFAVLVTFVFWFLQSRSSGGPDNWWYVPVGIIAAAWASWGWSASLSKWISVKSAPAGLTRIPSTGASWLIIAAWFVATAFSLVFIAVLWQVAFARAILVILLLAVAAWWLLHGWLCNLRFVLAAGALSLLLATAIALESFFVEPGVLKPVEWLGLERIAILTALGLAASVIASLLLAQFSKKLKPKPSNSPTFAFPSSRYSTASLATLCQQFQFAGGAAVASAALLTVVATLAPVGATPYGGNWAALMLISYGSLAMAAGVFVAKSMTPSGNADMLKRFMLPAGQVVLLLGTVRLCQTSPILDSLLETLRPERSWAVGTSILAVTWSWLAVALRLLGRQTQRSNIDWLCGFSALLGLFSALAIWSRPDHFHLALEIGWFLPLTTIALFLSWRTSGWRETSLLALTLWLSSGLYSLGYTNQWWPELGLAGSIATFVVLVTASVVLFEMLLELARRRLAPNAIDFVAERRKPSSLSTKNTVEKPEGSRPAANKTTQLGAKVDAIGQAPAADLAAKNETTESTLPDWLTAGPRLMSPSLISAGWVALCLGMLGPVLVHTALCLNAEAQVQTASFVVQAPHGIGLAMLVVALTSLTAACIWLGRLQNQPLFISVAALLPVGVAFLVAAWVVPPYSLAAALWVLGSLVIISDLAQFVPSWQDRSQSTWQHLLKPSSRFSKQDYWLLLGRIYSLILLVLGSGAFLVAAFAESLPISTSPSLSDWSSNVPILLISLGPVILVTLVRWGLSVWNAEQPRMIASTAIGGSLFIAFVSTLSLAAGEKNLPDSSILFLQSLGLSAGSLAWATLDFTWLRNFLGLRAMLGGKISRLQLATKSMKGARWQRSEQAAWTLSHFAIAPVIVLCVSAAVLVVAFPAVEFRGVERLGGWVVAGTTLLVLALVAFLSSRRGASKFGLLAATLGLTAPLAAAAYTCWLVADPSRRIPDAMGFEPIRALITLWLGALVIGLAVRISALRQGKTMKTLGESAWVILAVVVAGISIMSTTQDPNFVWPLFELNTLALITVLSGVFSGQAWRGHLAAIAAAVGLSGWLVHSTFSNDLLHQAWVVLWGPTWVALVAVGTQTLLRRGLLGNLGSDSAKPSDVLVDTRPWFSVDLSVVLSVPLVSSALSFLWIAAQRGTVNPPNELTWWIVGLSAACLLLAIARLWNAYPGKRGLGVYLNLIALSLVLSASLSSLGELPKLQTWLLWLASGLGAMAIMAGLLRELVREASLLGPQLKLANVTTPEKFRHALSWMPIVHTCASLLALVPSVLLVLAFEERTLRVAATVLPFIGALSILPIAVARGKAIYRYCGLTLLSSSFVLLWWADLPNTWTVTGVQGSWIFLQRAFVGLIVTGIAHPIVAHFMRRKADWVRPLMNVGWVAFFLGVTAGVAMLLGEWGEVWGKAAFHADLATKLTTLFAWVVVIARMLQFAARPHATDAAASIAIRKGAVFGAELAIALLCAASYVHFPDLFGGVFINWWPIVVFAIAMASAGIGQWMRSIQQPIIGDPIHQSSLLLPAIPLAGVWWFHPESADLLWNEWGKYSMLLLTASALYGLHGWVRNSIWLRALSGSLALLAFWAFLHSHPNLRFFEHPQFWLLPPAIASLLFVEINRQKLDSGVIIATRYVAILVAYLSSTAEVFLKAFEGQLWQPLLLLALALAGVAAGIVMRVRAFLFCGSAFTMVALLGMVWHAQQAIGQVWPWWAFGIATGICLIVLLGYFEKNRPRVVAYLEQFKKWEQ